MAYVGLNLKIPLISSLIWLKHGRFVFAALGTWVWV